MLLSIGVYSFTGVMLFYLGWHYNKRFNSPAEHHSVKQYLLSWEIIASFVLFSVITGLRYHTGWDHEYYIKDYVQYQDEGTFYRKDFEPGFRLLEIIFAKLGLHYSVFFGFCGFINIFFIYLALRKEREVIPWVGLLILTGAYFLHLMNSLRQGLVECALVSSILFLCNKKYGWFVATSLLLVLIHKVSLFIIPLFLLGYGFLRLKNSRTIAIIYICCLIIGQFPMLTSWTINGFSRLLSVIGYHKYVDLFNTNPQYSFHRSSFGIVTLLLFTTHIFLITYLSKLRKQYHHDKFFSYCCGLSMLYICYFVLVMNTAVYFKRPCELLLPSYIIMSAYLMVYLFKEGKYPQLTTFCVANFSISTITILKNCFWGSINSTDLYHFIPL